MFAELNCVNIEVPGQSLDFMKALVMSWSSERIMITFSSFLRLKMWNTHFGFCLEDLPFCWGNIWTSSQQSSSKFPEKWLSKALKIEVICWNKFLAAPLISDSEGLVQTLGIFKTRFPTPSWVMLKLLGPHFENHSLAVTYSVKWHINVCLNSGSTTSFSLAQITLPLCIHLSHLWNQDNKLMQVIKATHLVQHSINVG